MFSIIGGTYYENCKFPTWDELYGSGLRACLALESFDVDLHYYTCLTASARERVNSLLESKNIELTAFTSNSTVEFYYLHGLSAPRIINNTNTPITERVEVENALVFGMLDANIIVNGNRIVYDPQAPLEPKLFSENGSKCESLALVLNSYEAKSLTKKSTIDEAGKALLEESDVVIIKQGSNGASVYTDGEISNVPAYKTSNVFTIGSGDVFSSIFSYFWLEEGKTAHESASLASKATALYCDSKALPIEAKKLEKVEKLYDPLVRAKEASKNQYDVYLAGPFFTVAEYWLVNDIRSCMQNMGLNVFSPIHDVGTGRADIIAQKDLDALNKSSIIYVVADGSDIGTFFEVGHAQSKDIPVIIFSSLNLNHSETMLTGTGCEIFYDLTTSIYKTAWKVFEG
ncbi:MAG: nucleoside 2-deoxyribosyltransferase [Balneola sp.]|nr:nucleoside 2-deoxyribosyltransferase [Balneola sp.]|tara:strand:- start:9270 stop:10472 length:1203 start_codon:yes stop_codon:yes gene_type:complete